MQSSSPIIIPQIEIDRQILLSQIDPQKMDDGGYNIFAEPFISAKSVQQLREQMDKVFNGEYSTGKPPTKTPAQLSSLKNNNKNNNSNNKNKNNNSATPKSVIHMINISKADLLFQQLALHPAIGEAVAKVMNWPSVKFAQDQVWFKPPGGSSALSFHRDSPYFDMVPQDIATLWITLDDLYDVSNSNDDDNDNKMKKNPLGPLEYCFGSHKWGNRDNEGDRAAGARTGSASQFFDPDYYALLRSAAQREADSCNRENQQQQPKRRNRDDDHDAEEDEVDDEKCSLSTLLTEAKDLIKIEIVAAGAGGGSIHNGRTFHGSGPNVTPDQPRRGIGIHYVRGDAKFRKKKILVKVMKKANTNEDDDENENANNNNNQEMIEVEEEQEVLKLGKLWEPLKAPDGSADLVEEHFPTIFPVKREEKSGATA